MFSNYAESWERTCQRRKWLTTVSKIADLVLVGEAKMHTSLSLIAKSLLFTGILPKVNIQMVTKDHCEFFLRGPS